MRLVDDRQSVVENIGSVNYLYAGSGDIAQYKAGLGWQVLPNLSIGANFIYYLGALDRDVEVQTNAYLTPTDYSLVVKEEIERYNMPSFELGFQYRFQLSHNSGLILGGVYQPNIASSVDINYLTQSYSEDASSLDTLFNNKIANDFSMPQKIGIGVNYNYDSKMNIAFDYTNEQFSNSFSQAQLAEGVSYRNRNTFAAGFEYTPNRYDVRFFSRRMTYRVGLRYANSYLTYNDNPIDEYSISAGVTLPFNSLVFSSVNIGAEYTRRGSTSNGMISSNIFNIFIDVALFTNQQWFQRFKFD